MHTTPIYSFPKGHEALHVLVQLRVRLIFPSRRLVSAVSVALNQSAPLLGFTLITTHVIVAAGACPRDRAGDFRVIGAAIGVEVGLVIIF